MTNSSITTFRDPGCFRPSPVSRINEILSSHFFWRGFLPLLPLLLLAQQARADANDTFSMNVGTSVQHNSNLFLLSSSANPSLALGKPSTSEQISTVSVGLKLNKQYSLQRFELDASVIDNRYQTFDYLNYTARNYSGAWRWKVTPSFYGNLTSARNETLNNFTNYTGYKTRNVYVEENHRFDGVYEIDGVWRLLGGISEDTQKNSQLFTQQNDNRITNAEAGILYSFRSGSSLSYSFRSGHGEYNSLPQPILVGLYDNRFDDRQNEIRLLWALTGNTTLDAHAGHVERKYAHFDARNYGGNTGNVNLNWQISGKSGLTASWARDLSSYQDNNTSYISTDRFSLTPFWQFNEKTGLRLRLNHARLDYRGAIVSSPLNNRVDTQNSGMISLEWQALRKLTVSATLQSDKRTCNLPGFDYDAKIVSVSAQYSF